LISKGLNKLLDKLGLKNSPTVYSLGNKKWEKVISSEVGKHLRIIEPNAFYVFNKQPYILFFDLTGENYDKEREDEIHKKVWSFDQSPVIFILKDTDIEVYNAFAYQKRKDEAGRLQKMDLSEDEIITQFSFWNLQSGSVWTEIKEKYYKGKIDTKRVNQKLFDNIKFVRECLTDDRLEEYLSDNEANTLILRLIFIRYLIDRGIKLPHKFIQGQSINQNRQSFIELISKPRLLNQFFSRLNDKFNGVLFKDTKVAISKEQAIALSKVFAGESADKGTLFYGLDFFFEIFDFSIIPVELISGIYESLIDIDTRKLDSAVYTPAFLVDYVLNETIDKHYERKGKTEIKVFDPSVGSGIFLVQSYRRMVEKELEKEGKISKVRLRQIAENNLFGIDINPQALRVTCFSIYIAMLDYQDPKSILVNFHFPNLIGTNLFEANFFDVNHSFNDIVGESQMDYILGNPPWKSDKDDTHVKWIKDNKKVTGRYEIAQSFLLRSKDFMSVNTVSSLIVTSTVFYNVSKTTQKFKKDFLTTYCIDNFLDLSPVRRLIFKEKNSPCAVVNYRLSDGTKHLSNLVKHKSVKSNLFLKYFNALVVEKFDQKEIVQKYFIDYKWMFKVALYGNVLDFHLLKKYASENSLGELYQDEIIARDGLKRDVLAKFDIDNVDDYITEKKEILMYYTPNKKKARNTEVNRVFELFGKYRIILKGQTKNETNIVISYNEGRAIFRNDTFLVCSDKETIQGLYCYLIADFFTYFQYLTSSTWGIATRPAIRLQEYLSFPIIEAKGLISNKFKELANEFIVPFKQFHAKFTLGEPNRNEDVFTEINEQIEELYNFKTYEKDIIDFALDVSRYQFQESKQDRIVRKVHQDKDVLKNYASVFLKELKAIFKNEYIKVNIYALNHFIAIDFQLQSTNPKKKINFIKGLTAPTEIFSNLANSISLSKGSEELYIQKDIKGFEENSFYIIKPNEYKLWHRAMAWYDVAEIKEALELAEINNLKQEMNGS